MTKEWKYLYRNVAGYRVYQNSNGETVLCADAGMMIEGMGEPCDHDETPEEVYENEFSN